jgi:hypothetical protein
MGLAMIERPNPQIPDPEIRKHLRENLLAASAGLRAWSEEMQAATDELDRQYNESPIGQWCLRQRAASEVTAPRE